MIGTMLLPINQTRYTNIRQYILREYAKIGLPDIEINAKEIDWEPDEWDCEQLRIALKLMTLNRETFNSQFQHFINKQKVKAYGN
jgi:hypothetical protein